MDNNILNNNDSGTSGDSVKGRFRERLRLIKINRFKKWKNVNSNEEFINDKIKEIDRLVSGDNIVNKRNRIVVDKKVIRKKFISASYFNFAKKKLENKVKNEERDRFVRGVIRKIRETVGDRNYVRVVKAKGKKNNNNDNNNNNNNNNEVIKEQLKVKIINDIKKDLGRKNAELEVLQYELSLIKEDLIEEVDISKVNDLKREIDDIRVKVDNIIRDYNIYRDSYDLFDIDLDCDDVMDDIIRYKDLIDKCNYTINDDYKLLDEYRILYTRLSDLTSSIDSVMETNKEKLYQLQDRDYKFYNMKRQVDFFKNRLDECNYQISRQSEYIDKLMKKIKDIDKVNYTTYKFKGINELVSNSIKYISLLMINPLIGIIPSIAVNTLATRKVIKNIHKNLRIEKIDKVRYEAVNYDLEIRNKLNDLDYTGEMIDDTIKMIDNLKIEMIKQFGDMSSLGDTLKKLDDIRDKVVNDRDKLDIVKKKMVAGRRVNDDKLVKVRKLNNASK